MAWLEYGGRLRRLAEGATVVGGTPSAGLHVGDADLLPRHFVLRVDRDDVFIRIWSLDSVVALNGRQIAAEECRLDDGDTISAGSAHFHIWRNEPDLTPVTSESADNRPPKAHLIDTRDNIAYPLDRLSTNIGRSTANVIRLKDPTASRFHAQVRREAGGFALHSVGSSGTRINGRRVGSPQLLEDGDEIEIAYTTLRYTRATPPEGVTIVSRTGDQAGEAAERPTIVRERMSLRRLRTVAARRRLGKPALVVGGALLLLALAALFGATR
ncbi:MAG: FHA domain-containing protein [Gemmatimonadota bacterium]|nr:FHA domain-containing protein [Gemmatimonadota bacterium]